MDLVGAVTRSILIVDDDPRVRTSLSEALADGTTDVRTAERAEDALSLLADSPADVVLTDVRMPGIGGLELLNVLKQRSPNTAVVLMTAYQDLPTVATAMRDGAVDFLVKPLDLHQLRRILDNVFVDRRTDADLGASTGQATTDIISLIGRDPQMVEIFKTIGQVAGTPTNVIIRGESGTGKELIARAIHTNSAHASAPFVAVDCTALPATLLESELFGHVKGAFTGAAGDRRGRFALAGDGTIFLDEIGDTSPEFQGKLLRVLQEQEFYPVGAERPERTNARVIAATHRNLEHLMATDRFREDLYYRLRVVEIVVPPLRERGGDVSLLAEHLISKASDLLGRSSPSLSPEAMHLLLGHSWPGNVRELENCLTRAVVMTTGSVIRTEHLGLEGSPSGPARLTSLEQAERTHLAGVLHATDGHKSRAAEILEISRPRLDRLIEKHGLTNLIGKTRNQTHES